MKGSFSKVLKLFLFVFIHAEDINYIFFMSVFMFSKSRKFDTYIYAGLFLSIINDGTGHAATDWQSVTAQ